jgi:hypothetical protein
MNDEFEFDFDHSFYKVANSTPMDTSINSALIDDDLEHVINPIDTEVVQYKALDFHWFYTVYEGEKVKWLPFSFKDSANLENNYKENK